MRKMQAAAASSRKKVPFGKMLFIFWMKGISNEAGEKLCDLTFFCVSTCLSELGLCAQLIDEYLPLAPFCSLLLLGCAKMSKTYQINILDVSFPFQLDYSICIHLESVTAQGSLMIYIAKDL